MSKGKIFILRVIKLLPMEKEKNERISFLAHILTGILAGIASWYVHAYSCCDYGGLLGVLTGIVILLGTETLLKLSLKIDKLKWFFEKGGAWYFIGVWYVTWVLLFNLIRVSITCI